jgi:transcriptional regulator of arginine metabolism
MDESITALEALRQVLSKKGAGSQEDLREELLKQGFDVNQSTISRGLRKLGAIKTFSPSGEAFYKLPDKETPPSLGASLGDLVLGIRHNDFLIVIQTTSGSASLIAELLDNFGQDKILGTVAGDNTIFVAIPSGRSVKKFVSELNAFFNKR